MNEYHLIKFAIGGQFKTAVIEGKPEIWAKKYSGLHGRCPSIKFARGISKPQYLEGKREMAKRSHEENLNRLYFSLIN